METLLQVARSHKAPRTICECATCLYQLMQDRESWPIVVAAGEWHSSAEQQGLPKDLCSNHGLSMWNLLWLRVLQAAGRLPLLPFRIRQPFNTPAPLPDCLCMSKRPAQHHQMAYVSWWTCWALLHLPS